MMDKRMNILFLGDLCLSGNVERNVLNNPKYDPFDGIRHLLREDDLLVANIECATSSLGEPKVKYATLRADPGVVERLDRLDVGVLSNNHIGDFGDEAAQDTRQTLEQADIETVGWGSSLFEAIRPNIIERGGVRIGFLAFSCLSTNGQNYATPDSPGVAPISTKLMRQAILSAKRNCDVLVTYMHWGNEYEHEPVVDQLRVARRAIDWGADIVVGCHAHVVQTYEYYRGRWIFYGLGNFLFSDVRWGNTQVDGNVESGMKQKHENRESLAVKFTMDGSGSSCSVEQTEIYPLMFGNDLIPRRIGMEELTFDLNKLNRKQARYVKFNSHRLEGNQEICYETTFHSSYFVHKYSSCAFDREWAIGDSLRCFLRRILRKAKHACSFGELLLVFSNKKNVANHRFLRRVYNRLKKFLSLESKDSEKTSVGSKCDYAEIWAQYPSDAIPLDGPNRPKLGILKNESNQHEMYVKACIDLDVPFEEIDITSDAWIEEVKRSDCEGFLVRPPDYSTLANTMCKERVIILANTLQKIVFPSVQEILLYENKRMVAYWLQANKIPHPRTNIFYDKEGALIFAKLAKYPLVYKTALGSAGMGVRFLRSYDEAEVLIEQAFCQGIVRKKGDPRDRSWGHVLFQEYIEGGREFRIIRIGDSFFGHEKLKKNGMHSGSNLARWGPPPRDCLDMCYEISEKGNFRSMCFDVLMTQDGLFLINELHCIFGAYNPSQMYIDDRPGRYQRVGTDWVFEEGLFCRNACANLQVAAFLRMLNTAEREITL